MALPWDEAASRQCAKIPGFKYSCLIFKNSICGQHGDKSLAPCAALIQSMDTIRDKGTGIPAITHNGKKMRAIQNIADRVCYKSEDSFLVGMFEGNDWKGIIYFTGVQSESLEWEKAMHAAILQ
uniref:Uncharacterized LOC100180367 n=1 Tax=Ciona intestinalis TaxID=7719 RepID=H2XSK8_CIOIN|nr:uncharacterized protein LOC100180367 [Ciona intestinalis]|eukprot:XP_002125490.1 uncharacterized protein LOC100180367 [Ciona intestinalis]